jgi:hypothetical protein
LESEVFKVLTTSGKINTNTALRRSELLQRILRPHTVLLENFVGPGFFLQRRQQRQTEKLVWRPGGRCNSWIATGLKLTIRGTVSGAHWSAIAGTTYGGDFPAPLLLCCPTFYAARRSYR